MGFSRLKIDKNSLWGGSNIEKRELCVKGILAQDLGFVWGLFRGDSGDFREKGGEGAFPMIWRSSLGFFEAHPGTRVPSAPYSPSLLRLKVSVPGIVWVTIKVIVVHGELREKIPDVSGRWGMGLGSAS